MVRLGPLFGLQFLLSTEVAFTLTLSLVVAVALGVVLVPRARRRLVSLLAPLAAAAGLAALLTLPFLYYALTGFQSAAVNSGPG